MKLNDLKKKVFLGGTTNDTNWRDVLIPMLKINYFNPVVKDWNEEAYKEELRQREECDYVLYVITPKMLGVYAVAEAIDDSNKRPKKCVFCVLPEDAGETFDKRQMKSMEAVKKMVKNNGATVCNDLKDVAAYLNG